MSPYIVSDDSKYGWRNIGQRQTLKCRLHCETNFKLRSPFMSKDLNKIQTEIKPESHILLLIGN